MWQGLRANSRSWESEGNRTWHQPEFAEQTTMVTNQEHLCLVKVIRETHLNKYVSPSG